MARDARERVRLLDWLNGSPGQWGVWIGDSFIVAAYDSMFALFDRQSGLHAAPLWHGSGDVRSKLDQMLLESYGEVFEFF